MDSKRVEAFMGKMVNEIGAMASAPLVILGDRLGLYATLAARGPSTSAELAEASATDERYLREWLRAQAAAGYVSYEPGGERYFLDEIQALVFAREGQPLFLAGGFENFYATMHALPRVEQAFRSGAGIGWHEHHPCLFRATERFFRAGYNAHLVAEWLPALDGVVSKLEAGATVADIGCGHGASTVIMAKAYPASSFHGFDYHAPSIDRARELAREEGVEDRVSFSVAAADAIEGRFDLACIFDALHDMGDPVGAATRIRQALEPDGTWMLVEPYAEDVAEANFNPIGRLFYSASTMVCTPASRSQPVGLALGAQAGEGALAQVARSAGFSRFRRVAQTPFNMVFEVRP